VKLIRVESAEPYGWVVYLDGCATTRFFTNCSVALRYARDWSRANAPSLVQIVGLSGRVEREETCGASERLIKMPPTRTALQVAAARSMSPS
jgi:hypothetical protein